MDIIAAIKSKDLNKIKELISSENVNQQDEYGWAPLNWASGQGNVEIVAFLVEQGADLRNVGRDQRTPYQIALAAAHTEVAILLRSAEQEKYGEYFSDSQYRKYSKAYPLSELQQFNGWKDGVYETTKGENTEETNSEFGEESIVFLHEDLTVTGSMWHGENLIFSQSSPEWEAFCYNELEFQVPDDLDLVHSSAS